MLLKFYLFISWQSISKYGWNINVRIKNGAHIAKEADANNWSVFEKS